MSLTADHDTYELTRHGPTHRACSWCAADVAIHHRPGRPRLYCGHTCRQRAYEHRHGFRHERTIRTLPGQTDHHTPIPPTSGTGYERGGYGGTGNTLHALRPSVRPEGRRRETLCGLLSAPSNTHFTTIHPAACHTCSDIATRHPLRHPIQPSNELARLRAIIDETAEHRLPPTQALAWLLADRPPST